MKEAVIGDAAELQRRRLKFTGRGNILLPSQRVYDGKLVPHPILLQRHPRRPIPALAAKDMEMIKSALHIMMHSRDNLWWCAMPNRIIAR